MRRPIFGIIIVLCFLIILGHPGFADDLHQQSEGSISYGETVRGRVRTPEGDSWTFAGEEGDFVTISLEGDTLRDPYLELFDPAGIRLAYDDDGGIRFDSLIRNQRLQSSGTYTIVASGFGGRMGSYSLTLETGGGGTRGQGAAGFLEYGQTVEGRVTNRFGEFWSFNGTEGDAVLIDVVGLSLDDTVVELFGPDMTSLYFDDDGGEGVNSRIAGYELPETGSFTIAVRGYDNRTGTYRLTLDQFVLELEEEGLLEYGETQSNQVNTPTGDRWTFEGSSGDTISIVLVGVSLDDTYLELWDPDDVVLMQDDDSGPGYNSLIRAFTLPVSGTYSIIARGYNGRIGTYSLSLMEGEAGNIGLGEAEGELRYGDIVTNEITSVLGDNWTFIGAEGDVVSIDLVGVGLEDTYLELYDPDGYFLASDDDSGGGYDARIDGLSLPYSGTYTIVAQGYNGTMGTYELTLLLGRIGLGGGQPDIGNPTPEGEIEFGEIVEGNVETEDGDLWTFTAQLGQIVTIELNGASLQDTYLELYDPQGWLETSDDDSGPEYSSMIEEYILPHEGTFSIVARGYGGETGTYSLELTTSGIAEVDLQSQGDMRSIASISSIACGLDSTFFVLTIDGQQAQANLQQVLIEATGPGATIAQVFPVIGDQMDVTVGSRRFDVQIQIENVSIVSGLKSLFEIATAISEELDRQAATGLTEMGIIYQGNQGDLKFVVWGSHPDGGSIRVSTYWGEPTDPSIGPTVPEGMSGQLVGRQSPCE